MSILIYNAQLAGKPGKHWLLIEDEKIADFGTGPLPEHSQELDADGAYLMPGVIDCHVHFREPGLTDKADIASESRAALAGGVTTYLDMPNTKPQTTTKEAWLQKCELAKEKSLANYGFFIGATNDNIEALKSMDYTLVPGVKLFMGSSTGNMLVDDSKTISRIFSEVDAIVAVHAEDQGIIAANASEAKAKYPEGVPMEMHPHIRSAEACYKCTSQAVELAKAAKHRLHICHITTERELSLLESGTDKLVTSEVSPHHLYWSDEDYGRRGSRIKMNPAVKSRKDRDALRRALQDGLIDMVATDHAPHRLADKAGDALTATSGAPLVQFALPLMLKMFDVELVQKTMCEAPAKIYGIVGRGSINKGYFADLVLVKPCEDYVVTDADVISKCGWTPLEGETLRHRVIATFVNGHLAYHNGRFDEKSHAHPVTFQL